MAYQTKARTCSLIHFTVMQVTGLGSGANDTLAKVWIYQTKVLEHSLISLYCDAGDRPYLVSGADDKLAKVWDYQTKACVQTLEGHSHNVSAVCFHPELPVILTGQLALLYPPLTV